MPHVSKQKLNSELLNTIYIQLVEKLAGDSASSKSRNLTRELLTTTEKVMLAKRLALIAMLGKGYTFEQVSETLKVSPSTVTRFAAAIEAGQYRGTVEQMRIRRYRKSLDFLLSMLVGDIRPKHGPRWKWLDEL